MKGGTMPPFHIFAFKIQNAKSKQLHKGRSGLPLKFHVRHIHIYIKINCLQWEITPQM